jgi:dTDP-4-amino-4,6-dideoxygalactose transaminase
MKKIPFSPPDISDLEVQYVVDSLKSGWITTGPKTKLFEKMIADYCGTNRAVCFNSATAAMEMTLHFLGVGPGDEVITSAYTYTASASVIHHVGAKIVLVDIAANSLEMDYDQLAQSITKKTKVIIPVDVAGVMCDYDRIIQIAQAQSHLFMPNNDIQKHFGRPIILADAAHAFGATYHQQKSGTIADFTCFSFHAVKCLTTAEGGAVTWSGKLPRSDDDIYKKFQLLSLHGQNKDALSKNQLGTWEYDIVIPGYKCNMTDIAAAMGIAQLERYEYILQRRDEIIHLYDTGLINAPIRYLNHIHSSKHLYITRIDDIDEKRRNDIIMQMAEVGVACNVHYKPLPMMTAYKTLGFSIHDFPNSYDFYRNEITLPLHTLLTNDDVAYIVENFKEIVTK